MGRTDPRGWAGAAHAPDTLWGGVGVGGRECVLRTTASAVRRRAEGWSRWLRPSHLEVFLPEVGQTHAPYPVPPRLRPSP